MADDAIGCDVWRLIAERIAARRLLALARFARTCLAASRTARVVAQEAFRLRAALERLLWAAPYRATNAHDGYMLPVATARRLLRRWFDAAASVTPAERPVHFGWTVQLVDGGSPVVIDVLRDDGIAVYCICRHRGVRQGIAGGGGAAFVDRHRTCRDTGRAMRRYVRTQLLTKINGLPTCCVGTAAVPGAVLVRMGRATPLGAILAVETRRRLLAAVRRRDSLARHCERLRKSETDHNAVRAATCSVMPHYCR